MKENNKFINNDNCPICKKEFKTLLLKDNKSKFECNDCDLYLVFKENNFASLHYKGLFIYDNIDENFIKVLPAGTMKDIVTASSYYQIFTYNNWLKLNNNFSLNNCIKFMDNIVSNIIFE